MIRKILLGYDGSAAAGDAFAFAVDLALKYGAELHVLAVAQPPVYGDDVETEAAIEDARRRCETMLKPLRAKLARAAPSAHFEIMVGHPANQIVRYTEAHGIDHIVVGHRGHTFFERWLLGSVARHVIANAHCAVTVVRR